ncbi:uncharacterized protein LOC115712288 isoform X2 [Cannabis sativa]|uniref:uncharacterized protein LOC115712288 isoform X2 n=1 Tax=Cannabis sativa TaxID=3483 RepID=UPI0029CA9D53|nr:uncharacterized protein LOC115712288 isoform X2 [Cannabis sativa]
MSKAHGEDDGPPDYGNNEQESQEIEGDAPTTQLNIQTDAVIVHRAEKEVGEEQPIADDFELEEEEFFGEPEVEKQNTREPEVCSWWAAITDLHIDNDAEDEGLESESDLASGDSDEDSSSKTKLEYNPSTNIADFKWDIGLEFGNVQLLRTAVKEYFIHINAEYKLLANDLEKFRAKCRAGVSFLCIWTC